MYKTLQARSILQRHWSDMRVSLFSLWSQGRDIARMNGFYSCRFITAHGIGKLLHMPPMIPHFYSDIPYKMQPGNAFTIEPIFMMKQAKAPMLWSDEWTMISPGNPSGTCLTIFLTNSTMGTHNSDH